MLQFSQTVAILSKSKTPLPLHMCGPQAKPLASLHGHLASHGASMHARHARRLRCTAEPFACILFTCIQHIWNRGFFVT